MAQKPDEQLEQVRAHPNRTLAVLTLSALAYAVAQTMVVPALPAIQRHYHASADTTTWLLTAFLLTSSVSTPLLGRLGDMFGKERLLIAALAMFAAGSLIDALAHSIVVLIVGRAVQGGGGAIFPLAFGIIRDEFPRERVAVSIGTLSSMFGIGGGFGLVASGLMVDHLSIQWIFWTPLLVTLVAAVGTHLFVPESPVRAPARLDFAGAGLLALCLSAILLGVSKGNAWGWTSAGVLGLFAAGTALLAIFVAFESRIDEPLVNMRTLRARPVATTNVAALLVGMAMFGSYILIPELVQLPRSTGFGLGVSVTESGLLMLPSALAMLFAGPLSGRLGYRFGSRLPLGLGALVSAIAYASLAGAHSTGLEVIVGTALLGIGIGLAFAAMANLIVEAVPQEQTGVATGINTIMRSIGGAVGAQIAAAIVTASIVHGHPGESGFVGAFAMSGIGALLALAVTFAIPRRREPAPDAEPAAAPAG